MIIDLIFHLINLSVLIGIGIYLYLRFFKKTINAQIELQDSILESLDAEYNDLLNNQTELNNSIEWQKKKCEDLKLKVHQWKETVSNRESALQAEAHEHLKGVEQEMKIQAEAYELRNIKKQVAPIVKDELLSQVNSYFSDANNRDLFFENILKKIENGKNNDCSC